MPFAAFMSTALYHPRLGYYSSGPVRSGRGGHFITSPELDRAFGALWARGFEQIWVACGRPGSFQVLEVGPGEGGLARAVVDRVSGDFADALTYRLIERLPVLERRQRTRLAGFGGVEWAPSLREVDPAGFGCVFANEVVDNLPVHLVEQRNGSPMEVCVEARDGRFVETLRPPSNPELVHFVERCGVTLQEGVRFEVGLAAESLIRQAAATIGSGAVVIADYGLEAIDAAQRPAGALAAYSTTGADTRVLERPGKKDITAHANWTALRRAGEAAGLTMWGPHSQRAVLKALGLDELGRELKALRDDAARTGRGADAVRAGSRRSALGVLADPAGLGGLGVMMGMAGIPPPPFAERARHAS
jgi:SAM-dependent MidA family methyltransferase